MPRIGVPELLLIAAILVFLFGGRKIAELGTGLGKGIRNFRDSMREGRDGSTPSTPAEPPPPGETR